MIANGDLIQSTIGPVPNVSPQHLHISPPTVNLSDNEPLPRTIYSQHVEVMDTQDSSSRLLEQIIVPKQLIRTDQITPQTKGSLSGNPTIVPEAEPVTNLDTCRIWTYTGSSHYSALAKVCHLLGLICPKTGGTVEAKRLIESHINDNKLIESPVAKQYGNVEPAIVCAPPTGDKHNDLPSKVGQNSIEKSVRRKESRKPAQRKRKRSSTEKNTQKRGKRQAEEGIEDNFVMTVENPVVGQITTINDSFASQDEPPSSDSMPAHQQRENDPITATTKKLESSEPRYNAASIQKPQESEGNVPSSSSKSKNEKHRNSISSTSSLVRPSTVCLAFYFTLPE